MCQFYQKPDASGKCVIDYEVIAGISLVALAASVFFAPVFLSKNLTTIS